jgi:hypothetical protein
VGRWDFLEGVKAVGGPEAVALELAKVLAEELRAWPLRLEWTDPTQAVRFAAVLADRPTESALRDGFRLARWDLLHETDAIDQHVKSVGLAPAVELVWRWLVEATLELAEKTEGRVKRTHLVACLDRAERLLLPRPTDVGC